MEVTPFSFSDLSHLRTGEFWIRLADGTVKHGQARDYEK
jgi:hypothetical protein